LAHRNARAFFAALASMIFAAFAKSHASFATAINEDASLGDGLAVVYCNYRYQEVPAWPFATLPQGEGETANYKTKKGVTS
jgi:hypothetical protein